MAGNPQTLIHAGRPKGATAKYTRVLKKALILAAEKSKHSKDGNLESYCTWLADDEPELFVMLLSKLLPLQAKIDNRNIHYSDFNCNTPLPEMVSQFAARIQSAYVPAPIIEHEDPEDEEEPTDQ